MEATPQKVFSAGVITLIFNMDFSKLLLLKRNEKKQKKFGYRFGNIGGVLETGEYSVDGAIREAREEIGIELDKDKMILLELREDPNWSEKYHSFQFIYGTTIDEEEKILINEESEDFGWFDRLFR